MDGKIIRGSLIIALLFLIVLLVVLAAFGHFEGYRQPELVFPEAEDPYEVVYDFSFRNRDYTIRKTLYKSYFDFYSEYAEYIPNINDQGDYYNFIKKTNPQDDTINRLVTILFNLAESDNLNRDQTLELAMRFVQSIPYDDSKAAKVTAFSTLEDLPSVLELLPRHPYVTLFDQQGVCSDKTILASLIAEEMGYGTAIFSFDGEDLDTGVGHIGLGLKCPISYSVLNSGYCYVETTAPVPVGTTNIYLTPDVQAVFYKSINEKDSKNRPLDFGIAELFILESGDTYQGIIETYRLEAHLETLETALAQQSEEIEEKRQRVNQLNMTLSNMAEEGLVQMFYNEYDEIYTEYEKEVKEFNLLVEGYNRMIEDYNQSLEKMYY